ncbi:MAG: hypothetical protein KDI88_01970 [Gammaproteobacteria bacterium]|nr:hypothetical protein [Gammaproteobacteria bacterium]
MQEKTVARVALLGTAMIALAGCSGPTEDVRVTFCKGLTESLTGARSIEWTGGENTFKRPEYAVTGLAFAVEDGNGGKRTGRSACYYAYEALDDTAQTLADPLSAHATLPFAMSLDGRMLPDAELVAARIAEQKRHGMAIVNALGKEASDLAEQVRAGIGQ